MKCIIPHTSPPQTHRSSENTSQVRANSQGCLTLDSYLKGFTHRSGSSGANYETGTYHAWFRRQRVTWLCTISITKYFRLFYPEKKSVCTVAAHSLRAACDDKPQLVVLNCENALTLFPQSASNDSIEIVPNCFVILNWTPFHSLSKNDVPPLYYDVLNFIPSANHDIIKLNHPRQHTAFSLMSLSTFHSFALWTMGDLVILWLTDWLNFSSL